jgi:hypothetical protein
MIAELMKAKAEVASFEATSSGKAYFAFIRGDKCIIKSSQEWYLRRTNKNLEEGHTPDEDGCYWSIVNCDNSYVALSPVEGHIMFKQFNEWQDKLEKEWHYMFDKFAA